MRLVRIFATVSLVFAAACGDDGGNETPKDAPPPVDSTVTTPDADCFDITNVAAPTHDQIINACTTATKIYKTPTTPLINADGTLPPLPQ